MKTITVLSYGPDISSDPRYLAAAELIRHRWGESAADDFLDDPGVFTYLGINSEGAVEAVAALQYIKQGDIYYYAVTSATDTTGQLPLELVLRAFADYLKTGYETPIVFEAEDAEQKAFEEILPQVFDLGYDSAPQMIYASARIVNIVPAGKAYVEIATVIASDNNPDVLTRRAAPRGDFHYREENLPVIKAQLAEIAAMNAVESIKAAPEVTIYKLRYDREAVIADEAQFTALVNAIMDASVADPGNASSTRYAFMAK